MFSIREVGEDTRLNFEAAVYRLGQGKARQAFSRAINHETSKANTQIKRGLRKDIGLSIADINRQIDYYRASGKSLKASLRASGAYMSLKEFKPRQFSYGVRVKVWGRYQRLDHAFIGNQHRLGGHVFKNTRRFNSASGRFNAIEKLWGPSIPKEMVEPKPVAVFDDAAGQVLRRAMHELERIMGGAT